MLGTLVNCAAIIGGSLFGLLCRRGIKKNYTLSVNKALGIAVVVIGLNGVISNMFTIQNGVPVSSGELLLVFSLVIGVLIGEWLRLDDRLNSLGGKIEHKFRLTGFSSGLVNASLIFCVGAMSIIGSLNDGLRADPSVLYIKSALDCTASVVLAATLGAGVLFSFIPVLIYQGAITLGAGALSSVLQGPLLAEVCTAGYAVILMIGLNFLFPKLFKTANFLPALLVPPLWHALLYLASLAGWR
ncbi:MAG: DUF554 domain-containing protein [Oscillospiraceae bacterium]|nr:DUF554 domain-containing protein [Oscillospiraceae bacterium]